MLVRTVIGGIAAKVALGVGVATASVTAAGAAGVLPQPAQHAVASVVGAATPFQLPDPSTVTVLADDGTPSPKTTTTLIGGAEADDAAGDRKINHGACVSAAAQDTSGSESHGKTVSSVARSDCGKTKTSTSTTVVASTTSTTAGSGERSGKSDKGPDKSNSGKGNSGNGKSGKD